MLGKIYAVYFSGSGNSEKVAKRVANKISKEVINLNAFSTKFEAHEFASDDLIVIAAPVFSGRIAEVAIERFKKLIGNNAQIITLLTYGNRDYEDALLELNNTMIEQGFKVLASAALVAQHSLVAKFAEFRPDLKDLDEIEDFADKALEKFKEKNDKNDFEKIIVPGNSEYKKVDKNSQTPVVDNDLCILCSRCARQCPVEAIPEDKPNTTEKEKCIMCTRCIKVCPMSARQLNEEYRTMIEGFLEKTASKRRENEFFL